MQRQRRVIALSFYIRSVDQHAWGGTCKGRQSVITAPFACSQVKIITQFRDPRHKNVGMSPVLLATSTEVATDADCLVCRDLVMRTNE